MELAPLPTPLPEGTGDSEDTGCQWRKEDRSTFTALPADSARDPRSTGRNSASKSQALSLPPQPAPPCPFFHSEPLLACLRLTCGPGSGFPLLGWGLS